MTNIFLYLLFVVELLLLIISLKKFDKDIFSPTLYSVAVFLVSTILNIYCIDLWSIHFSSTTFLVIALGLLSMFLAESLFCNNKWKQGNNNNGFRYLNLSRNTEWAMAIICIVCTFLYYREIKRLGLQMGIGSMSAIGAIKENYGDFGITMNPFVRQGYKIVIALSFVSNFYLCNHILFKQPLKKLIPLIIPFFCAVIISILGGGRSEMLRQLITFVFMYYIQFQLKYNWQKKPNKNIIKILVPGMAILLTLFFSMRLVVKENSEGQLDIGGPVEYLSYYIASPVEVLDIHVQEREKHKTDFNFGIDAQAMSGIRDLLGIKTKDKSNGIGSGFSYLGDNNYAGNVDTIFGPPHMDYGLFGMMIYVFVIYCFFSYVYYKKIIRRTFSYKFASTLIFYSYFFYEVILCFYSDCTYLLLSQTGILQFIVLWIMCRLLVKSSFMHNSSLSIGNKDLQKEEK